MGVIQAITYDRHREPWKGFETGAGQRRADGHEILTTDGRPDRSFNWLISHDIRTNIVTRIHQAEKCCGNWKTAPDPDEDLLVLYTTKQALLRLGT